MKLFVTVLLAVSITSGIAQNPYRRDDTGHFIVEVGSELPSFQFVTLSGDTLDSDVLRGQTCIVQFVASWCPYSQGQMLAIEDLIWKKYKNKKDIFIVAFSEDFAQDTANFRLENAKKGISYSLSFDVNELIFKQFVTSKASIPRIIISDKNGTIVALEDEFYRKSFRRIRKKIKQLLE